MTARRSFLLGVMSLFAGSKVVRETEPSTIWAKGMSPSEVNDSARAEMAAISSWRVCMEGGGGGGAVSSNKFRSTWAT